MKLDYTKTYERFIAERGIPGPDICRADAGKRGLQGHHIRPKCQGNTRGRNNENIVWLTPVDHCVAHWIMAAAAVQRGEDPIGYIPANCTDIKNYRGNLAMRWNPLSKVRIRFETGSVEKVVTAA